MTLQQLLSHLRSKRESPLGTRSLENLHAFLQGFLYATIGTPEGEEGSKLLAAFDDWVRKHYKIQSTQGWARTIAFFSNSQDEEFHKFWELYDRFLTSNFRKGRASAFATAK